jgi:DnaJ-class molecular chaperone
MMPTLYMILDVPADADQATIAAAYTRLYMDDTDPNIDRSTFTYAYLVLSDTGWRAAYDFALRRASEEYLGYDVVYDITVTPREADQGTTRTLSFHQASGQPYEVHIDIPPGVSDGMRLLHAGKGGPSVDGRCRGAMTIVVHVCPA